MNGSLATLAAIADWRSFAVLGRNARVFLRNWRTAFFPPAMEPVVYFLAFGLGLGGYVGSLVHGDRQVSYATWVSPGLLAYAAFGTPFYEALYASYVRMFYQKTWDGILATQVEIHHIVWGEILWAALRGVFNTAIVALVLGGFHIAGMVDIAWWWLPLTPLIAFLAGCAFAAFGLIFTVVVPSIDHMNYPLFLVGIPLSLVSATYFPVRVETPTLRVLIELNPLYHLAELFRAMLVGGNLVHHACGLTVTALGFLIVCALLAQRLTRKRVLGR